jgi:hypothetical protein
LGAVQKQKMPKTLEKSRLSAILAHATTISYDKAKNFGGIATGLGWARR